MLSGMGMFNVVLRGQGWVALTSKGTPIVLDTREAQTFVDTDALVALHRGAADQAAAHGPARRPDRPGLRRGVPARLPGPGLRRRAAERRRSGPTCRSAAEAGERDTDATWLPAAGRIPAAGRLSPAGRLPAAARGTRRNPATASPACRRGQMPPGSDAAGSDAARSDAARHGRHDGQLAAGELRGADQRAVRAAERQDAQGDARPAERDARVLRPQGRDGRLPGPGELRLAVPELGPARRRGCSPARA